MNTLVDSLIDTLLFFALPGGVGVGLGLAICWAAGLL